jgi:hypothetical protein
MGGTWQYLMRNTLPGKGVVSRSEVLGAESGMGSLQETIYLFTGTSYHCLLQRFFMTVTAASLGGLEPA